MNVDIPMQIIWGLVGYILVTTWGFIWWAATTTQQLKTLREMVVAITTNVSLYARKDDITRELGILERNMETMWGKFDKLKEKVDSNNQ